MTKRDRRVDEDVGHPQRDLHFAQCFDLSELTNSCLSGVATIGGTYIASFATVKVTHVRDIDLERALYLLVLGQDGLDRIVVVIHLHAVSGDIQLGTKAEYEGIRG